MQLTQNLHEIQLLRKPPAPGIPRLEHSILIGASCRQIGAIQRILHDSERVAKVLIYDLNFCFCC